MTSWVVVDSSTILATVLTETQTAKAKLLLEQLQVQGFQLAAPSLIYYEFVSVIRKRVNRGDVLAESGNKLLDYLFEMEIRIIMEIELLKRAYEIANQHKLPSAYDAQYLAVAESLQCDFWTADERLYNTVSKSLTWVKWVGNA